MNAERRQFYLLVVAFSFLTALLVVLAGDARAESASDGETTTLFILDGSGSMWGQIDGQPKITIAKEVMTDLIRDLSETVDVGLLAYGHRRKGDCKDIEILVPAGEGDPTSLTSAIQAITPKGKTPITRSLEVAAEQLRALEEEATVVLVSDGEETCDADPCARLREIKESGINVTVHVVGFDVSDEERRPLTCIAEAGGGRYFTADNAPQLQEAFRKVRQEIVQKPELRPAVEPAKRTIALATPGNIVVKLPSVPAGSDELRSTFKVEVKEAETGSRIAILHRNVVLHNDVTSAPVRPSSYSVELNGSTMTVNVGAGETVEMMPAVIEIANLEAHGKLPGKGPIIKVRNVDSGRGPLLHRGETSATVWPGTYQVDLSTAGGGVETVTLTAGEVLTLDLGGAR